LKRGHERLIACDDLGVRRENRFTNVGFVGGDGRAVGEADSSAVDAVERGRSASAIADVAGAAGFIGEQLFTGD
jgi:hypothetical protein